MEISTALEKLITENKESIFKSASKIANGDIYLSDLIIDWAKEKNNYIKDEMLKEIGNYTYEVLRSASYRK